MQDDPNGSSSDPCVGFGYSSVSVHNTIVGSVTDRTVVRNSLQQEGVDTVASLHKPHVAGNAFERTVYRDEYHWNAHPSGRSRRCGQRLRFHFHVQPRRPCLGTPCDLLRRLHQLFGSTNKYVHCIPKNIYGVTKDAAESLCRLFHRNHGLPCIFYGQLGSFPKTTTTTTIPRSVRL